MEYGELVLIILKGLRAHGNAPVNLIHLKFLKKHHSHCPLQGTGRTVNGQVELKRVYTRNE